MCHLGADSQTIRRNCVLPKASRERRILSALDIAEPAKKTAPVIQGLPDVSSNGCNLKKCFGRKGGTEWSFVDCRKKILLLLIRTRWLITISLTRKKHAFKDSVEDNTDMDVQVTGMPITASSHNSEEVEADNDLGAPRKSNANLKHGKQGKWAIPQHVSCTTCYQYMGVGWKTHDRGQNLILLPGKIQQILSCHGEWKIIVLCYTENRDVFCITNDFEIQ
ncbi:hypothetical protein BDR03DRAFT_655806 [Suillus americanus]|nr:hypothetical protein BDR03DRAFT_655806 [Suillus americanus]